jgi:uncharacterized protein DUF6542
MAMSTADAWQQGGARSDRSFPGSSPVRPERAMNVERSQRPVRGMPPRGRATASDRRSADVGAAYRDSAADHPRGGASRRPGVPPRDSSRGRAAESVQEPAARGRSAAAETGGRRTRGIVASVLVFLVTLAGAGIDSFVGIGLGMVTLIALVGSTVLATLIVRRRDLVSMVIAPPLVFVAVAGVDIALAPSAHFNLATIATLMVRGFPTMGIATVAALVLALIRWASRR